MPGEETAEAQGLPTGAQAPPPQCVGPMDSQGQEAEASRVRYTTPKGVWRSDPWTQSENDQQQPEGPGVAPGVVPGDPGVPRGDAGAGSAAEGTPTGVVGPPRDLGPPPKGRKKRATTKGAQAEEPGAKDPGGGHEAGAGGADEATPAGVVEPTREPTPKGRKKRTTTPTTTPETGSREGEELVGKDPGGGNEGGAESAADATPTGIVEPKVDFGKPKAGRGKAAKDVQEGDGGAPAKPKRGGRRAKAPADDA